MIKYIKKLLLNLQIWHSTTKLEKEIKEEIDFWLTPREISDPFFMEEANQIKYQEALLKLKTKVNELVQTKTKEEYNKVLKKVEDMITLVDDPENTNPHIETLKRLIVYKDKDIQDSTDKKKMIEARIGHFYELQEHKVKREMSRKIRQLENEGKIDEAEKLTKYWKERYLK